MNLLLAAFGLVAIVAPLAVAAFRELAPSSADPVVFAFGGGLR